MYEYDGTGWILLDDADPRMSYTTNVDGAYLGFVLTPTADDPRGIDCILFL